MKSHSRNKQIFKSRLQVIKYKPIWSTLLGRPCDFSSSSPVWILGRMYVTPDQTEELLHDFRSRLWFTYRKDFAAISTSSYTSDAGWGCMLRTGQMLLAEVFIRHFLGRDWRYPKDSSESTPPKYKEIVKWFVDCPDRFYSIHKIAQFGTIFDKQVGEWFGPQTISNVLQKLVFLHNSPEQFTLYISDMNTLYIDDLVKHCSGFPEQKSSGSNNNSPRVNNNNNNNSNTGSPRVPGINSNNNNDNIWRPLIILMPLRLGLDKINSVYYQSLCSVLEFPQSVGIIGGRPKHSLYFIGYQDKYLIYLDPHTVQPAQDAADEVNDSYHCKAPRKMAISSIDPSMCVGFYCRDRQDFDDFCMRVKELAQKPNSVVNIRDKKPPQPELNAYDYEVDECEYDEDEEEEEGDDGNNEDEDEEEDREEYNDGDSGDTSGYDYGSEVELQDQHPHPQHQPINQQQQQQSHHTTTATATTAAEDADDEDQEDGVVVEKGEIEREETLNLVEDNDAILV